MILSDISFPVIRDHYLTLPIGVYDCKVLLYPNFNCLYFIQRLHPWEDEEELHVQPKLQLWPSQQSISGLWTYGEMGDCSGKEA